MKLEKRQEAEMRRAERTEAERPKVRKEQRAETQEARKRAESSNAGSLKESAIPKGMRKIPLKTASERAKPKRIFRHDLVHHLRW